MKKFSLNYSRVNEIKKEESLNGKQIYRVELFNSNEVIIKIEEDEE